MTELPLVVELGIASFVVGQIATFWVFFRCSPRTLRGATKWSPIAVAVGLAVTILSMLVLMSAAHWAGYLPQGD